MSMPPAPDTGEPIDDTALLPGLKPVMELLARNPDHVDSVFCKKGLRPAEWHELQDVCRRNGVRLIAVASAVLDRMCRHASHTVAHQGVVARLSATSWCSLTDLLDAVPDAPLPVIVALDQVQDPGNVGTLCRTLYALGGAGLLLPRHNTAYLGPAAHRAAAGALEHLPVARVTNLARALDSAEEAGLDIYGAVGAAPSENALVNPPRLPAVLVLGNENRGLRPGVAKRCRHRVHIPLARPFDSLNVAQAGGMLLALIAAGASRTAAG